MAVTIYGSGQVPIQVVQTVATSASFSAVPNTTWTTITPLNASITPKSTSSQILIMVNFCFGSDGTNAAWGFSLLRNSTRIFTADNAGGSRMYATYAMDDWPNASGSVGVVQWRPNIVYLDSPSTTSAVTYGVQVYNGRNDGTTFYFNRSFSDNSADAQTGRSASSVVLMEISGA